MHASVRLSFLLLITITTAADAQYGTAELSGPGPSQLWGEGARAPLQQSVTLDSVPRQISPTYWKEGALVGGVVTGLGLAVWVDAWCRGDDCGGPVTGGFVLGAVLGGLTGALVGGQFPKDED